MLKVLTTLLATTNEVPIHAPKLTNGWTHSMDHNGDVTFVVRARERNIDQIKIIANQVSDPKSPEYGNFLTTNQLNKLTEPKKEHVDAIRSWLNTVQDATVVETQGRTFQVTTSSEAASKLLSTTFHQVTNSLSNQTTSIATDYSLPSLIHEAANLMGLHGLPLPPRVVTGPRPPAGNPANVTPAVILSQYGVSGVTPDASSGNLQAVAEFQGQTMSSKDLSAFFTEYVPNAPPGSDKVSKFVGDAGDKVGQTEASLDIQYIMGVAPGIATEFWLYDPNDFCADLKNWTETLLADETPPLVTSVSYGWQGNLTQIGCKDGDAASVDSDFAKLAAKGITIIFASGDSGSGYKPANKCESKFDDNTELEGTSTQTQESDSAQECCDFAQAAAGFTFTGPDSPPTPPGGSCSSPTSGVQLDGTVYQTLKVPEQRICCEFSDQMGTGYSYTSDKNGTSGSCTIYKTVTGNHTASKSVTSGTNKKRVQGKCQIFSTITGKKTVKGKTSSGSGGPAQPVVLWPSWPASSPFVTSVGATRFIGQKAGNDEMASDQFGSGGGFSKTFSQDPNAKWQSSDVAHYLKVVPSGLPLPPAGSFPAMGRATPDVSALGEGFQVLQSGRTMAVGGTSASAPTFSGIVSLLNEHRLQAGKKPLGFLNPFLYQNSDAFTDIIQGTNAIGRGTGPIKYGFNCTAGWDPATGMGSPNFAKLLKAVDALP